MRHSRAAASRRASRSSAWCGRSAGRVPPVLSGHRTAPPANRWPHTAFGSISCDGESMAQSASFLFRPKSSQSRIANLRLDKARRS
jgi:hypothetical protein